MPKISVIVPIYNVEKYLEKCLDSLKSQTMKDIEIICVNDGSTDSCPEICDKYAKNDARIKVIHKQNAGYGSAINSGISEATGKYIGILESDDFADKKMYENLWNLAEQHQADIVKCSWYEYFTDSDTAINVGTIPPHYSNKVITYKDFHDILKNKTVIWGGLYKKDFLLENNIKCLETPGASYQDTSFNLKALLLAKRMILTEKPYVYYRKDNMDSSVKSKGKVYCICDEYNEINSFLNKNPEIKQIVNYRKLINEYNHYVWNTLRVSDNFRQDFINKFSETFHTYYKNGELNEKFFKKINKKEFETLLFDKEKFYTIIRKKIRKKENREKRKLNFSLRISFAKVSLVAFGKQIIKFEF